MTALLGHFHQMDDKYGYSDGQAVPVEGEALREVLVAAINAFLSEKKSPVKAVPYNRPGIHNWLLIDFVDSETGESAHTPPEIEGFVAFLDEEGLGKRAVVVKASVKREALAEIPDLVKKYIAEGGDFYA